MLRPCICMRPSPSFIPSVCSQRLWTDYGPVNILPLLERGERGDFLTISTFLFRGETERASWSEGESKPSSRAPGTSDGAEVSIDERAPASRLSLRPRRPSVHPSVSHIPAGGRPLVCFETPWPVFSEVATLGTGTRRACDVPAPQVSCSSSLDGDERALISGRRNIIMRCHTTRSADGG